MQGGSTKVKYVALELFVLALPLAVAAQTATIRISDQTGAVIPGAQVTVLSPDGAKSMLLTADANGTAQGACQTGMILHLTALGFEPRTAVINTCSGAHEYTAAGLKLSVPVRRNLNFFGTADNLLNHRYQVLTGYPMPGINGAGGFVLHF